MTSRAGGKCFSARGQTTLQRGSGELTCLGTEGMMMSKTRRKKPKAATRKAAEEPVSGDMVPPTFLDMTVKLQDVVASQRRAQSPNGRFRFSLTGRPDLEEWKALRAIHLGNGSPVKELWFHEAGKVVSGRCRL